MQYEFSRPENTGLKRGWCARVAVTWLSVTCLPMLQGVACIAVPMHIVNSLLGSSVLVSRFFHSAGHSRVLTEHASA